MFLYVFYVSCFKHASCCNKKRVYWQVTTTVLPTTEVLLRRQTKGRNDQHQRLSSLITRETSLESAPRSDFSLISSYLAFHGTVHCMKNTHTQKKKKTDDREDGGTLKLSVFAERQDLGRQVTLMENHGIPIMNQ